MTGREPASEVGEELVDLGDEVVGERLTAVALERVDGLEVGARRAADSEVDPVAVQAGEDAELLGHLERAVVREHHPAAADANTGGGVGSLGHEDLGGRAANQIGIDPGVPGIGPGILAAGQALTELGGKFAGKVVYPDAAPQTEATPIIQKIKSEGINWVAKLLPGYTANFP